MRRHRGAYFRKILVSAALAALAAGCGDISLDGGGAGLLVATSVSSGDLHSCAVSGGGVKCWGRGSSGQLGNGGTLDAPVAVIVSGLTGAIEVASGGRHSCARLGNGQVWCWGENSDGQLGNGTFTGSKVPVQTTGISTATAISAGAAHTCALLADGTLRCWGANLRGQLGNNTTADSNVPVQVSGLALNATAVAAGGQHTCAVLSDQTARCWGSNASEQLGNASLFPGSFSRTPVVVTGVAGAQDLTAGSDHACASVTSPGPRVRCWGNNFSGQLGSAWTVISFPFTFETTSNEALTVNNITTLPADISGGADHTCAAFVDGVVRCWGENFFGQLGNNGSIAGFMPPGAGASATATVFPVLASSINTATRVSSGLFHACALASGGRVLCWGLNTYGQLGDGTTSTGFSPVLVSDAP